MTYKADQEFWSNVKIDSTNLENCWLWGSTIHLGYGTINRGGKVHKAHRLAYESYHGPIPKGLLVRHRCDVPACVHPLHLELGTHADSSRDAVERGRTTKGRRSPGAVPRKLTWEKVREIRARWSSEKITQTQLTEDFGVSNSMVYQIVNNHAWVELDD